MSLDFRPDRAYFLIQMGNVSILWDIENVTPNTDSMFIDGLSEYAESFGRVVAARAYCDWSKPAFKKLGPSLSRSHFYLVHVPRERNQKNSADMNLISDTLELLRMYDHIDTFLLVTGDSDFRALVLALRRAGKRIRIVCDMKKASQDLLAIADSFVDYRELTPGGDEDASTPGDRSDQEAPPSSPGQPIPASAAAPAPREHWFEILAETTGIMLKEGKSSNMGTVKIRLRMLNPNFDEKSLGFKRWSDFVAEAVRAGYVKIEGKDRQALIYPVERNVIRKGQQQRAFETLLDILKDLDNGASSGFHDFATVNARLNKQMIDFKELRFRKFKVFIQAAETRGLVESKAEGLRHFVRISLGKS